MAHEPRQRTSRVFLEHSVGELHQFARQHSFPNHGCNDLKREEGAAKAREEGRVRKRVRKDRERERREG